MQWEISLNPGAQTAFVMLPETVSECLFGGAAGPGKTHAILVDNLWKALKYGSAWYSIIFRKTYPQLRDIQRKAQTIFGPLARYHQQSHTYHFLNGATVRLGHLQHRDSHWAYDGEEFTAAYFDELTHWADPEQYDYIRTSRLRSTDPRIHPYVRATSNPGKAGHHWVKRRFVDPAPEGFQYLLDEHQQMRIFLPATLDTNPHLSPDYRRQLESMADPVMRLALRYGQWEIACGAYYEEMRPDLHLVEDFTIPPEWERALGYDFGFASECAAVWVARSPQGIFYVFDVFHGEKIGLAEQAQAIHKRNEIYKIKTNECFADPSIFAQPRPSLADRLAPVKFREALNNRLAGWTILRELLACEPLSHSPRLLFFRQKARYAYECLSQVPRDRQHPEDLDTQSPLDHLPDALRYALVSRWFQKRLDSGTGSLAGFGF